MLDLKTCRLVILSCLLPLTGCTYFSETVQVDPSAQRYWSNEGRGSELEIRILDPRVHKAMANKPAWIGEGGEIVLEEEALNKLRQVTEDAFRYRSFAIAEIQTCELAIKREDYEEKEKPKEQVDQEIADALQTCQNLRNPHTKQVFVKLKTLKYRAVDDFWQAGNSIVAEFSVQAGGYKRDYQILQGSNTDMGRGRTEIDRDMSRVFSEFIRQLSSDPILIRYISNRI